MSPCVPTYLNTVTLIILFNIIMHSSQLVCSNSGSHFLGNILLVHICQGAGTSGFVCCRNFSQHFYSYVRNAVQICKERLTLKFASIA